MNVPARLRAMLRRSIRILVIGLLHTSAAAQTVVTDTFESGAFSPSWVALTGTTIATGSGAAGSARFASVAPSNSLFGARFDTAQAGGMANFTIDTYIKTEGGTSRQFQLILSTSAASISLNSPVVNLRHQAGIWSLYNGASWLPVYGLNVLTPGAWHRLRVTGRDWGQSGARIDIELSSAGGSTFTSASAGLTTFQTTAAKTALARYFVFTGNYDSNPGFFVDNVNVTGNIQAALPVQLNAAAIGTATQSAGSSADFSLDNNPATISETPNTSNSFWELELERPVNLTRVQLLAPSGAGYNGVLNGVVVKVYNLRDQLVFQQTVSGAVAGELWTVSLPPGVEGRIVRLELPPGGTNGAGDQRIAVAEVKLFSPPYLISGTNYALGTPSYMVRLTDTLPPPSYANDGSLSTTMETTDKSVDGYWETDLGQERALSSVRIFGLDSATEQARLAHATLRLFDANHQSVYSKHLEGAATPFDLVLPGPVLARYVRVGFENKERSHATGGIEWFLRIREVEAYGSPADQAGILSFTASDMEITSGESVTLNWQTKGIQELEIHPAIGSAAAATATNGTGQITVSPSTTTEYMLVGNTPTRTFIRYVTVRVNGQSLPPRISEIMAENELTFRDGYNDAPDWIELRNPNHSALDITGYCLSDSTANPAKWAFPSGTSIPPHGFLVVCASGRNLPGTDEAGFLHTNFSLNDDGETLLLAGPAGTVILDTLNFPEQEEDLSYGRTADGSWKFLEPSPGAVNLTESFNGWLQAPIFSHSRGFQTSPFSLILTNPNPGSQLLYSLDGSEPSLPYTGPIPVSASRSVRAKVRRDGYRSPRTRTHSYLFPNATPNAPGMNTSYASGTYLNRQQQGFLDLPTISLSVPDLPDDYIETEGSVEIFMPGTSAPIQANCGMERFGGAWTEFTKKSYRLNFSAEYGQRKLEAPLFNRFDHGIPVKEVFDSIELRAGNHDMEARGFYMGSRFIEDTTLEMGSVNPHGRFVHVYVNGSYWGMYDARERMVDAFLAEYLGGKKEDYVNVRGNDNVDDSFIPGTPEPPNRALWESARTNRSSYAAIKDKVDVSHLIDFMLVWFYGESESEYRCAGPIASGTGFKFWLADPDGYLRSSALNLDRTYNAGPGGIFGSLVTEGHPDFKTLLADRIQKHFFNNGALTPARNLARMNARMAEVQNAMVSECSRWGFRTPENWAAAAEDIRTGLFPSRTSNLFTMLRNRGLYPALDAPVLSQHGGSVDKGFPLTFSPASGSVVFTLDGSDPRLPGGAVSPTALTWSGSAQTLVAMNSTWKYRDLGALPAANWNTAAYNDSAWASGAAPLGYGNGDETTTVGYGPNSNSKYTTTYFRKTISVANPGQFSQLSLGLIRDDGVVIYLNGTEVARSNMPTGTIGYSSAASSAVDIAGEYQVFTFNIPANLLVTGNNLLAVEVHQHAGTSTDLRFDLSLTGTSSASAAIINGNATVKARVLNGSSWSALTEATFQVAYPLTASGPYFLNAWDAAASAGSYPAHMAFHQTSEAIPDPGLTVEMNSIWALPYNRSSRSRINGLGSDGFSFINTSDPQSEPGSGHVGAAILALNTSGAQDIRVTWIGGTVVPNARDYGIRLQYRTGDSGSFTDVTDSTGNPVEYLRNANAGHSQIIGPVTLPAAANDQPLVQLRWKYYLRSGISGARPQLRVDDIQVSIGHPAAHLVQVAEAPLVGQTGHPLGPVRVHARSSGGALATGFNGSVQVSIAGNPGILSGTTTRSAVNGEAVFDDLTISQPGAFIFQASSTNLAAGQADNNTRMIALRGEIVPRFIQGHLPTNDRRTPFAARFTLEGLLPNATYRYANRLAGPAELPGENGAGNMIFTQPGGASFVRSSADPSFLPADFLTGHAEFTTNAQGIHTGWFLNEPTSNARFNPGATTFPLLILNDGETGSQAFIRLHANDQPVKVMDFGSGPGQGSAVQGDSVAGAKNFVVLFDDAAGTTRPLAATPIESTGAATDPLYADFYETSVAGQPGRWGTMLPNGLPAGIRRIEARDGQTGAVISTFLAPDGHRPTTQLVGGLNSVGIHFPGPAESGFAMWQARHFSMAELALPAIGGPQGTPAGDGVFNLLKYAFGMSPFTASRDGLPIAGIVDSGSNPRLKFQYRRLTGTHGLSYQLEISDALNGWTPAESSLQSGEETQPAANGTENVTRYLPIQPTQPERFLRLRVQAP